jgi:hypothetical protein
MRYAETEENSNAVSSHLSLPWPIIMTLSATDKNEIDITKWARWPSPNMQITRHSVRQLTDSSSFCNFLLYVYSNDDDDIAQLVQANELLIAIVQIRQDRLWGPPSLLSDGYREISPGVRRPGREADHSPSSSAEGHE